LLRARNEAGQAVRLMEIGMVDDAATSIKTIAGELVRGQQLLKTVLTGDVDDEQGALLLSKLNQSFNALNSQGLAPMMAALNKQSPDDYYDLLGNGLIPLTRAFDNDVHAFQRWGEARGSREVASVLTQKQVMLALIGLVALLTAAIMTLVWLALRHLLLRPLEQSVEQLEHVAAGDLTRALTATSNNELGRLISAIETMRLSLAESVM
ncbi:HAMP domain-containing protein, partial [Cronobacter dublinensis]